ncbi:putative myeloid leukemia factor [Helianthus anomalus]
MDSHLPITHEHRQSMPKSSRGLIIEELNSDDEKDEPEAGHGKVDNTHLCGRELNQTEEYGNQDSLMHDTHPHPQAHSFTFQSSTVTYGRRFEEHKESDSTTGQAAHMISRGIHDKGHTLLSHLKSDGQVDTMQTLHNINEGMRMRICIL